MAGQEEQKSFLEMSDEEIANIDPSTLPATTQVDEPEAKQEDEPSSADATDSDQEGITDTDDLAAEKTNEQEVVEDSDAADKAQDGGTATKDTSAGAAKEGEQDGSKAKDEEAKEVTIDYKAEYERLTRPFKANGRDIEVKSVDDAISLMQMGANYNKKMAALKPNLRLMKLLENNGLLSEEKISFLIDLEKKSPEAISKLVKDSGLDPLDLDADKAGAYRPTQRNVDDREIELDTVLDELQDSPTYNRTLDIVSNKWDASSKQVIANSPQLLKVINSHVESGIYDLISKELENERVFGRLNGLSDIEAYRQVGDAIQARGGFNHLGTPTQGSQTQPKPVVVPPKPQMVDEDKRREKKLAAGTSKAAPPSKSTEEFNPLSMSDDEFGKLVNNKFL